ncbi:uncharacterized protein L201_000174 [Kwoniella dendrophila CBS 6074]|uniref:Uncharacterized protein n=1 Tax=Kwoniella dendrophila CBS 6074 TaxID=1295534 RepID=A0AAX4JIN0_9TREE
MNLWQSSPMHWQTYTTSEPSTPQLEEAFRRQASLAFHHSPQSIGYSVSSSFTTRNGITTGHTELKIGKSTPWLPEETASVEKYLVGLLPKGNLIAPTGRPVGFIESAPSHSHSHPQAQLPRSSAGPTSKMLKSKKHKSPPSITSFPSTVSEAGTIPPSHPPSGMIIHQTSPVSNHVHYDDQSVHTSSHQHDHHGQHTGGRFSSITKKFKRKSVQ